MQRLSVAHRPTFLHPRAHVRKKLAQDIRSTKHYATDMAPVSFSPDASISSHTLSVGSTQPPPMDIAISSPATAALAKPTSFLLPTVQLTSAFLAATKQFLDPLAAGVSEAQAQRQLDQRKKRKRGEIDDEGDIKVLQLRKLHTQGFSTAQVWQQASRILSAAVEEIERSLPREDDDTLVIRAGDEDEDEAEAEDGLSEFDQDEESSDVGEEGVDWEYDGEDLSGEDGSDNNEEDEQLDGEDIDMQDDGEGLFSGDESGVDEPAETYRPDPNGLNDGFFEIDQFNKQTDFLEQSALLSTF